MPLALQARLRALPPPPTSQRPSRSVAGVRRFHIQIAFCVVRRGATFLSFPTFLFLVIAPGLPAGAPTTPGHQPAPSFALLAGRSLLEKGDTRP